MTGDDILAAAERCRVVLEPALGLDWSAPVPDLDFTAATVVAHVATGNLWYSVDLWSGAEDAAFEVKVLSEKPNALLLASLLASARTLAAVVDAAPPTTRGFHPFGSPDPDGFAAMACDELLVHGHDAAMALGVTFSPDRDRAVQILARLYPWHEVAATEDPWDVLLWANGRKDRPDRPFQERWRWHSRPLSEWDGQGP
jgi:uncharacterized protein (TIGR03083 family)